MMDTLMMVSASCPEGVAFASGPLMEEETEKREPLPERPDGWK